MRGVSIAIVLMLAPMAQAGDAKLAGNWKVVAIENGQPTPLFLLRVETKGGKLTADLVPLSKGLPSGTVEEIRVKGEAVHFKLALDNKLRLTFEGKLPAAAGKHIAGSLAQFAGVFPAYLEPTTAKTRFELDRQIVERTPNDPRAWGCTLELLKTAKAEKVPAKDVQSWVEAAMQSSLQNGPRWHAEMCVRMLENMTPDFPQLAADLGKKMDAGLDAKSPARLRLHLLELLGTALTRSAQAEQAQKLLARIEQLEDAAYADYLESADDFAVTKYVRKSKSNRTVLVELFTGSQCPPCVGPDLAFDALEKAYKPSEVVLLQFHEHIPGVDPMTNADSERRMIYYGDAVSGTPTVLFNGKVEAPGGCGRDEAEDKYKEFRGVLEQMLDKDTPIKLAAQAVRKGSKIQISASVKNLNKTGDKVRLRFALTEDWVRYRSPNGLFYHHHVVRALPGGSEGTPLTKATADVNLTVDLDQVKKDIGSFLDETARKLGPFPTDDRPMRMRQLHLVAFVQNDANKEVLQAIDVVVKEK